MLVNGDDNNAGPTPKVKRVSNQRQQPQAQIRQRAVKQPAVVVIQTDSTEHKEKLEQSVSIIDPLIDPVHGCRKKKKKLKSQMPNDEIKIGRPLAVMPMIKIIGVNDYNSNDELRNFMFTQNKDVFNEQSHVEFISPNTAKPNVTAKQQVVHTSVIIKTDHNTFLRAMQKKRLLIRWDSCKVYEHINLHRCIRCSVYGHHIQECTATQYTCPRCAGPHSASECTADIPCCPVCVGVNEKQHLEVPLAKSL